MKELVAMLALAGPSPMPRDVISGRIWPDCSPQSARKALNTELWRFRKTLKETGSDPCAWLSRSGGKALAFRAEGGPETDLAHFLKAAEPPALPPPDDGAAALRLYRGEFAAGLDCPWADSERRRLHGLYLGLMRRTAEAWRAAERFTEAIGLAEQLVHEDPLDEGAWRALMELQIETGNRAVALRGYDGLAALLREELGVAPSPRTQALRARCLSGQPPSYSIETEEPRYRVETLSASTPERLNRRVRRLRRAADAILAEIAAIERLLDGFD